MKDSSEGTLPWFPKLGWLLWGSLLTAHQHQRELHKINKTHVYCTLSDSLPGPPRATWHNIPSPSSLQIWMYVGVHNLLRMICYPLRKKSARPSSQAESILYWKEAIICSQLCACGFDWPLNFLFWLTDSSQLRSRSSRSYCTYSRSVVSSEKRVGGLMYEGGEREGKCVDVRRSPPLIAVEPMVINRFSQILNRIDF